MECFEYCEVAKEYLFGDVHDGRLSEKGAGTALRKLVVTSKCHGETTKATGRGTP